MWSTNFSHSQATLYTITLHEWEEETIMELFLHDLWPRNHMGNWPQQYNNTLTLITCQNFCMGFFGNWKNPCNQFWEFGIGQMLKPCTTSGNWTWSPMFNTPLCYHLSKCLHLTVRDAVRSLTTYSVCKISMWGI